MSVEFHPNLYLSLSLLTFVSFISLKPSHHNTMSSSLPSAPSSHSSPSSSAPPPHLLKSQPPPHIPTFSTLLVLQFDISPTPHSNSSKLTAKQSRSEAEGDIRASWNKLEGLLGGSGLRVTCRPGVGKSCSGKEIWVFIGAEDEKISELAEQER